MPVQSVKVAMTETWEKANEERRNSRLTSIPSQCLLLPPNLPSMCVARVYLYGLDRLALLWETVDPSQPLWTKNAELYIRHRPGCIAVEWLTPGGGKRVLVNAAGRGMNAELALPKPLIRVFA